MDKRRPQHRILHRLLDPRSPAAQRCHPAAAHHLSARTSELAFFPASFGRDGRIYPRLYTAYANLDTVAVIPEYKVNLDKLIRLLLEEKARPTQAITRWSCSARGGRVGRATSCRNTANPDPYGHRKKASVAEIACRRDSSGRARARRRSPPTSPTTCDRAIRTSSTKLVALTFR